MSSGAVKNGILPVVRERIVAVAVTLATLAAAGLALGPLERPAWAEIEARGAVVDSAGIESAVGQGVVAGLLGGFRALAADFLWLKANASWEEMDLPATQTTIRAVTAIDPRPLYFWVNGARMIAYDMPVWRIERAGGLDAVPESVRARIDEEQAQVALAMLADAQRIHPGSPTLTIEAANIHLRRLGDTATAARLYREAAELPRAPFYAARIHAELLRNLGRRQEALDWLRSVHPVLPRDVPEAMAGIVLARIRELEEELGMPAESRYNPARQ
jgi:tetratricopeptide (TPR) repeat protein